MNYLFVICVLGFGISCSQPEIDQENLIAHNYRFSTTQQPQYMNGLELYKQAAVVSHLVIKQEIAELRESIDGGKKHLLPKLEAAQEKEASLLEYKMGLTYLRAPRGGRFPPRPPRGCFDDPRTGCIPKLNITGFAGIQITEGLEEAQVEIRNSKNAVVGKGGRVSHVRGGFKVMELETDFQGEATMYITPKSEFGRTNVLEVPVSMN